MSVGIFFQHFSVELESLIWETSCRLMKNFYYKVIKNYKESKLNTDANVSNIIIYNKI